MWFQTKTFPISLCQFKTNPYICNAQHLNQATKARQITLLRAFFMSEALSIISYSSVPCGVLMHPQPDSGVEQRGAELFLFPLRILSNILFILMLNKNEERNDNLC